MNIKRAKVVTSPRAFEDYMLSTFTISKTFTLRKSHITDAIDTWGVGTRFRLHNGNYMVITDDPLTRDEERAAQAKRNIQPHPSITSDSLEKYIAKADQEQWTLALVSLAKILVLTDEPKIFHLKSTNRRVVVADLEWFCLSQLNDLAKDKNIADFRIFPCRTHFRVMADVNTI